MKYTDYEKAFSRARLDKYLQSCGGDKLAALALYRFNVKLCQKFYGILNIFEVVLRNSISEHYKSYFSDTDWILHQLNQGGMLEFYPQKSTVLNVISDLKNSGRYTNDRVVSSVSLGFWIYMFTKVPFLRGGQSLLNIFPSKAHGLGQRAIYNELRTIKAFRNRIAHHEAICFDEFGTKSTAFVRDNYALLFKYVQFLGYSECQLFYGLDIFPDAVLRKIDNL